MARNPIQGIASTASWTRRGVMAGAAGAAALAIAGRAAAADEHAGHAAAGKKYTAGVRNKKHASLADAVNDCTAKGDSCLSHCMETFRAGDTTMAECADAVVQMLTVCRATASLARYDSPHLKDLARACRAVCADCEKACRAHADHQPECKACADACALVIKECDKLLA